MGRTTRWSPSETNWHGSTAWSLQRRTVMWYHHYLQHPGHTRLKETINAAMYWKGIRTTIQSITKSCRTCQTNKKRKLKYGHLPAKTVIRIPWEALCVDLIGPYTLKGKDGSQIDFMALTMIDPASSWLFHSLAMHSLATPSPSLSLSPKVSFFHCQLFFTSSTTT